MYGEQMNTRSRTSVNAAVNLPETEEPERSGSSVSSSKEPGAAGTVTTLDCILQRLRDRQAGLYNQELRRAERLNRTQDALTQVTSCLDRLEELRELMIHGPVRGAPQVPIAVAQAAREEVAESLLVGIAVAGLELPDDRRGRLRRGQGSHRYHPFSH